MSLEALKDVYLVSACIGAGYLGISILLGQVSSSGHSHEGLGHSGSGADGGQGDAAGHDSADGLADHDTGSHGPLKGDRAPVLEQQKHRNEIVNLILSLLSPSKLAMFLAFFGFSGLILQSAFSYLGNLSLAAALILGILGTRWLNILFNTFAQSSYASSEARVADMIGREAEVSVPVQDGRIGEILYVSHSKRFNFPARSSKVGQTFAKGSHVMISDYRDHIAYVEPWTDMELETNGLVLKVPDPTKEKQES
jgi:membrane protein implicated in regulation of membrane protease activity